MSPRKIVVLLAVLAPRWRRAGRRADAAGGAEGPGGPLYQKLCSQCHGEKGDGQGVAAPRLLPRPRDFTAGKFKIRHTPSGALPTDDDLEHVIRVGMPYTSMPAWNQLSDAQINELVAAVKSFSPDFANPEKKPKPIAIPKAPAFSAGIGEEGQGGLRPHRLPGLPRPARARRRHLGAHAQGRLGPSRSGPPT